MQIDFSSCHLLIGSTIFLFGGFDKPRQIIEIYPWGSSLSRRILTLPFDVDGGTCTYHTGVVYLCFNEERGERGERLCRSR